MQRAGPERSAALYFAYGSNLKFARMRERVAEARLVATASLYGVEVSFGKRGRDGSGKAALSASAEGTVWGVVYGLPHDGWARLDPFEVGYERVGVEVVTAAGERIPAETYRAVQLIDEPVAFDWYKALLVEGAREQGLPSEYVVTLEGLPARPDPHR